MICENKEQVGTWSDYYQKTIYHLCGTNLPSGVSYCEKCESNGRADDMREWSKMCLEEGIN